jgi:Ran GTPase-activating protein (RanGAP) involved in mRNA processing and transport
MDRGSAVSVNARLWETELSNPQSESMNLVLSPPELPILSGKLKSALHLKILAVAVQDLITLEIAQELEKGISKNRSLRHLSLKLLQVGQGVLKVLVGAVVRNPCLISLDLSQTVFPVNPSPLGELHNLKAPALNLRKLNLSQCKLSGIELRAVAACLASQSSSLTYLDLSGSQILPTSASELSSALKTNQSLTTLRLRDCGLGDSGITELTAFLRTNTTIDHFNLSSNHIGPSGAQALAMGIEQNQSIGHLNLSHNPIGPVGVQSIVEAISKSDSIRELDMGFCHFGSSSWTILAQTINTLSKLWMLNISGNMQYRSTNFAKLAAGSGIVKSIEGSGGSHQQQQVDVQQNQQNPNTLSPDCSPPSAIPSHFGGVSPTSNDILRTGSPLRTTVAANKAAKTDQADYVKSLEELCSALQVNSCLSVLDLSHNPFGDLGCSVLESLLASNQTIVELKLKRCGISSKGLATVAAGVSENTASSLSFVDITGNEADGLGALGDSVIRRRRDKLLAWRPVRSHPIVQSRPHAEFTSLCPVPSTEEIWVACTDGHVHFWPVSDLDNIDDVMHYVDVHSKPVPVTRRRINGMVACRSTVWVLTDESTIVVISQSQPHRISYIPSQGPEMLGSERLCMCIADSENQIAVVGGGSGDISLWKTTAGEEALITRKVLGNGFPVVAVTATPSLIMAGLVMPGRHSSLVVVLDHSLEEMYRQEVGTDALHSMACFGNMVITAFQNSTIRLWHCDSREMALIRSYSHIPPQSIQPLGSYFISSSLKHSNMCIWNPTSLTPVCILDTPLPVKSIAISGPYMAVLTDDEQVGLWVN